MTTPSVLNRINRRVLQARVNLGQAAHRRHARLRLPPSHFVSFGENSIVDPTTIVSCPHRIAIGVDSTVRKDVWLSVADEFDPYGTEPLLRIGNRVSIGRFSVIACMESVVIGDDVITADGVFVGDTYHAYSDPHIPVSQQGSAKPSPVTVKDGAFLGFRSIILPGVTVGSNAYVGAGAVVTKSVPQRTLVVGNPARVVRRWDEGSGAWMPERQD